MAKSTTKTDAQPALTSAWETAWNALQPIRASWDEKEQALMAQTNDSVSGRITATRVSDAALSTLAYERQARVAAQLSTGKVYAMNKKDETKSRIMNIVLNRYILPNANSQFDMLIKERMWGLYASVYGSMPMFYDYRVDENYIGPDCWLVDPRCFAPVNGVHNVQEAGCYISTVMHLTTLKGIADRKVTSYDKAKVKELIKHIEEGSKPGSDDNSDKRNTTVSQRYDLSDAKDRVEVVTKYTHKKWVSFCPDFADKDKGTDFIIRDMDNPHRSGRIPVVMRHCFPILNSIFGLGDFERGMKVQKAKDSIINLFLEGAKMRVYPPLKMIDNLLTPSTIRYQAGSKWKVKQQNAVEFMNFGNAPLGEFQATYSALQGMLQNMFGTSSTEISEETGGPAMGKTPQALKMQSARENARDTWDRFMHEKAVEELREGMINLLSVKMEKPIDMAVFEDDLAALGDEVKGLDTYESGKTGKLTLNKSDLKSDKPYTYLVDAGSSVKKDDEEQFKALMATWEIAHSLPDFEQRMAIDKLEYKEGEHAKQIFIAAGLPGWEKILTELSPEKIEQLKIQADEAALKEAEARQAAMMGAQQGAVQDPNAPPVLPGGGMPPIMPGQGGQMPPMQGQTPQLPFPAFEDPQVAQVAQMMLGGR